MDFAQIINRKPKNVVRPGLAWLTKWVDGLGPRYAQLCPAWPMNTPSLDDPYIWPTHAHYCFQKKEYNFLLN